MNTFFFIIQIIFALFMLNWLWSWLFKRDLRTDLVGGSRNLAWKIRCFFYSRRKPRR